MADGRNADACDHDGIRPRSRRLRRDCAATDARPHLHAYGPRPLSSLFIGEPRCRCAGDAGGQRQQRHPRDAAQALCRAADIIASMRRKLDEWYYQYESITEDQVSLSDRATACWTSTGKQLSRGTLLRLLRSDHRQWIRWRRSLPDLQWYSVSGGVFWLPGFV